MKARFVVRRSRQRALAWYGLIVCAVLALAVHSARAAQDAPSVWRGDWIGSVAAPSSQPGELVGSLPIHLRIDDAGGALRVVVTSVRAGALAKAATDVVADAEALGFTLEAAGSRARFEARMGEDRRIAEGRFGFLGADGRILEPLQAFSVRRTDAVGSLSDALIFTGTLEAAGQSIPMRLALGEGPNGWCGAIEIASQGLRDFPLDVARTAEGFLLTISVAAPATIQLTRQGDDEALEGVFTQGAFRGPIRFVREPGASWASARRRQDPRPPFPYTEREIKVPHPAGHTLAGTLVEPANRALAVDGRVPCVVFITGSGPQNRDEEILGHRPFAVIADALARAGVASFRYDDRGIGASTGDFAAATTFDLASDADIVVDAVSREASIDPRRMGLLGHSEGGIVAPIVAMWRDDAAIGGGSPPLAFVVLLAPSAEDGGSTLTRQSGLLYKAAGVPDEKATPALEAHARAMDAVRNFADTDAVRAAIAEMVRRQLAIAYDPVPPDEEIAPTIDAAVAQVTNPWMLEFIRFDPRPVLARLRTPSLAMCGTKDLQVEAAANLGVLDGVARDSGATVTTRRLEGLNHLFQPATTGLVDEYGVIETTFDDAALAELVAWVVGRAAAPASAREAAPGGDDPTLPKRVWVPVAEAAR